MHTGFSFPNISQHSGRKQSGDHPSHSQSMDWGFRDNICSRGQIKSGNFPGVKEKEPKSKLNTPLEGTEEWCALRADEKNENNKCFNSKGGLNLIDLKHWNLVTLLKYDEIFLTGHTVLKGQLKASSLHLIVYFFFFCSAVGRTKKIKIFSGTEGKLLSNRSVLKFSLRECWKKGTFYETSW